MAAKRPPLSLVDLPTDVAIQIAGHLAVSLVRPIDQLRALRATCRSMRRVCRNPEVGLRISVERLSDVMYW
jgi:hypothetical protein